MKVSKTGVVNCNKSNQERSLDVIPVKKETAVNETLDVQNTWDIADAFNNAVPHHLDPWLDEEESELRSELHKFSWVESKS